jgi:DNA-directed RNA polymerase specialized sigma24 family protein
MNMIHLTVTEADFPFLMEAINLRSMSLQDALRRQLIEQRAKQEAQQEAERKAKLAEVTPAQVIHIDAISPLEEAKPSLNERRAALKKLLSTKEGRALSIAEIARRAGVSYVTARKAVITKRKN